MSDVAVTVISTKLDLATDVVVERLRARGINCHRVNTEDYPFQDTLVFDPADGQWLYHNGHPIYNSTSVWYRRLRSPSTPPDTDEGVATFCRQEARAALVGSLLAHKTRWMSHPAAIWQAEYKPYQLHIAANLGLPIPRTIVTNDPTAVRSAFDTFGQLIVKPTRTGYLTERGTEYAVYTSRVLPEHLNQLEDVRWSPSIYQALVPKKYDVRVTIVGDQCFTAAIDSQSDPAAVLDWRLTEDPALPHFTADLPAAVRDGLLRLMKALQLTFGAVDLIETPGGDYVFLEVNPNGQWLWLDQILDLGISDAVAEWLGRRE